MPMRRVAISLGGGYVPGLAGVVRAAAQAAARRGWQVVGIRDGFDGLLFPGRYPAGGVVAIDPAALQGSEDEGSVLGTGARTDPFRVQRPTDEGLIEQVDASVEVLEALRERGIDALIGIVGGSAVTGSHALAVLWKLARQGLHCVCIPKSAENDLAATVRPFGFDSVLHYTAETLRHIRIAAADQRRVALVEVPGQYAGWLALEAGLAARADVVLIPELPYDAQAVAHHLDADARSALIVVAEGACAGQGGGAGGTSADAEDSNAGRRAQAVLEQVQRHGSRELFALVLGQLVRAGAVSAADRALGVGYAAAAVQALAEGHVQHLVAARGERFEVVPLADAVNRVRTVDAAAPLLASARSLGVCLGGE